MTLDLERFCEQTESTMNVKLVLPYSSEYKFAKHCV